MANKGGGFSIHQEGDVERLKRHLGSSFCPNNGRLTRALATLPPGDMIPKHPRARERFLARGE